MSTAVTARRLSAREWAALSDDVPGELVGGVLVEEEMADHVHDLVVGWLIAVVGHWVLARGGLVAASDAKFALAEDRGRKPDASVFLPGSERPTARGAVTVPPSIAIEVVSPTPRDARRDRIEKLADYAAFGVPSYWIVDPQLRTLEVLELDQDGRYVHALAVSSGVQRAVPGCAGLELDLDALWASSTSCPAAPADQGLAPPPA